MQSFCLLGSSDGFAKCTSVACLCVFCRLLKRLMAGAAHPEAVLTIILARIWVFLAPGWGLTAATRPQDSFGPSFSSSRATATHFTPETVVCVQRFQLGSSMELGNLPSDFQDCFRTAQRVLGLTSMWFLLRTEPWRPVS